MWPFLRHCVAGMRDAEAAELPTGKNAHSTADCGRDYEPFLVPLNWAGKSPWVVPVAAGVCTPGEC